MKKFIKFLVKWSVIDILLYIFIVILIFSLALYFGW